MAKPRRGGGKAPAGGLPRSAPSDDGVGGYDVGHGGDASEEE